MFIENSQDYIRYKEHSEATKSIQFFSQKSITFQGLKDIVSTFLMIMGGGVIIALSESMIAYTGHCALAYTLAFQ